MSLPKKISLGVLIFFAFYTITGFLVAPPIVKWVLTKKLSEHLHREVSIQKIKFNPYKLSTNVIGFIIENREDQDRFVSFNELYIDLQAISIYKKGLILKEVRIDGPYINIIRTDDSTYNFSDLLEEDKGAEKPEDDSDPFRFSINNIQVLNGNLDFLDGPKNTGHKVRDLTISIPMVSNFPYFVETFVQPFLKASVNDTDFIVKGKVKPFSDSLETIVDLDIDDLDITHYLAYSPVKLNFNFLSGMISAKNSIAFTQYKGRPSLLTVTGDISINKIEIADKEGKPLINLPAINISIAPSEISSSKIHLSKVLLQSPDIHIRRNKLGVINIASLVLPAETEEPDDQIEGNDQAVPVEADEAEDLNVEGNVDDRMVKIDTVTLQAGAVHFLDTHVKPIYSANLLKIDGSISGLSSEEGTLADVDLRGNLENYAPLEIRGKINPLIEDLYVDLKLDFKEMDLSSLTPYANKYVGYTIQKGKLSLELQYLIVNKKLDAKNNIYLDQFTFGDKVDSPDATTLPVKFAISLLKNSKGEISLDLPVSGNLDDPEFRIGSIVLEMVGNILVKAATSPFALLGAIVGGGEELSTVGFDYGSINLNDPEKAKLDKLIAALGDRPNLNMEIEGFVDIERDREGLRQFRFNKKLRARKLKEITDDDLRLLASDRALTVKDYILRSGQVDQKRIFLTEPRSLQPEEKEKLRNSRVDFKLK